MTKHGTKVHLWGRREAALQEATTKAAYRAPSKIHAQTKGLSPRGFDTVSSTALKGSHHMTRPRATGRHWINPGLTGNNLSTLTAWVWAEARE